MGTYVVILEGGGLPSPGLQDPGPGGVSAPVLPPSSGPAHYLPSQQRPPLAWAVVPPGNRSWLSVTHLPSAMELLNCIDGGAVAKASFVRATWSQPCLAERYIHYADSFYRDFQTDGPRSAASRQAPSPGAAGLSSRLLIDTHVGPLCARHHPKCFTNINSQQPYEVGMMVIMLVPIL